MADEVRVFTKGEGEDQRTRVVRSASDEVNAKWEGFKAPKEAPAEEAPADDEAAKAEEAAKAAEAAEAPIVSETRSFGRQKPSRVDTAPTLPND